MAKQSLKDVVYTETLNSIIRAEYKPGQILNEQELIDRFGYSKSPVREALIMLCNNGVLRNIPRCGYEVVRLTKQDIDEIMAFRRVLECGVLKNYGATLTSHQLEVLRQIDQSPCAVGFWEQWDHNQEFHLKLISITNNAFLVKELTYAMNILRRAYAQYFWDQWSGTDSEVINYHEKILDALEKKDVDAAVDFLMKDLGDLRL